MLGRGMARKSNSSRKSSRSRSSRTTSTTSTSTSTSRRTRRSTVDTESWISRHISELIEKLGLDYLKLSHDEYRAILTKIVDLLRGEASTINMDTIVRRFKRNLEAMYKIMASMLLEIKDQLTDEQLEFVINNIGDAVLAYASKLYSEAVKRGRLDLVDRLRNEWDRAWITKRQTALPVRCPQCGFSALMPDLTCLVCGNAVDEKILKEKLNFRELLHEFAKSYPREIIEATIKYGYVYLTSYGIKPPTERREPLDIEVVLTRDEKEYLMNLLKEKT